MHTPLTADPTGSLPLLSGVGRGEGQPPRPFSFPSGIGLGLGFVILLPKYQSSLLLVAVGFNDGSIPYLNW